MNNKHIYAHRLAYLYFGKEPPPKITHIDGNLTNNAWLNLRATTRSDSTGNIWVGWRMRDRRWIARGYDPNGKRVSLGTFRTHLAACYAKHQHDIDMGK